MAVLQPTNVKIKNGDTVTLRSYQIDDEEQARAFAQQTAHETTHTLKYVGMPAAPLTKVWAETAAHPVNLNIGAFLNDRLVANLRFLQRRPDHPWIQHVAAFAMAVSRDLWGQGIGSHLLQQMENHARRCGITRIEAEVRTANAAGVALYKKHGFKIEGLREKAALIEGGYVDEFYIAKMLL